MGTWCSRTWPYPWFPSLLVLLCTTTRKYVCTLWANWRIASSSCGTVLAVLYLCDITLDISCISSCFLFHNYFRGFSPSKCGNYLYDIVLRSDFLVSRLIALFTIPCRTRESNFQLLYLFIIAIFDYTSFSQFLNLKPIWVAYIYFPVLGFVLASLFCVSCQDPGLMERVTDEEAGNGGKLMLTSW